MAQKKMVLKSLVCVLLASASSAQAFDVRAALTTFQLYSSPVVAALVAHTWWNTGGEQDLNDAKAQAAAQLAKLEAKLDGVVSVITAPDATTAEVTKAKLRSRLSEVNAPVALAKK